MIEPLAIVTIVWVAGALAYARVWSHGRAESDGEDLRAR